MWSRKSGQIFRLSRILCLERTIGLSRGLKPRAESCSPFGTKSIFSGQKSIWMPVRKIEATSRLFEDEAPYERPQPAARAQFPLGTGLQHSARPDSRTTTRTTRPARSPKLRSGFRGLRRFAADESS